MGNRKGYRNKAYTRKGKTSHGKGKPFPIGVTLLLILLLSCAIVAACIFVGVVIDVLIRMITDGIGAEMLAVPLIVTVLVLTVLFVILFALIRHRRTDGKDRLSDSYTNDVLFVIVILAVGAAVTLLTLGAENDNAAEYLTGILMFPAIGIITTPNAVRYALRDMKKWTNIFYSNGNLHKFKEDENFYKVKPPVPFEKKLFWVVLRNQVLDHAVVIFIMILVFINGIARLFNGPHKAAPGLIGAVVHVRIERAAGLFFFLPVFFAAFAIPILAYYATNAVSRLSVVKKHRYIAYHAVVKSVRSYKMCINEEGRKYSYDYATCVGIKEKDVHDTKAILIFIPDDVLIFPDKDQREQPQ